MFEQFVFVEADRPQSRVRRVSAMASLTVQCVLLAGLLAAPLLHVAPPAPLEFHTAAPPLLPRIMQLVTRSEQREAGLEHAPVFHEAVRSRALVVPTRIPSAIPLGDNGRAPVMANPCPSCAASATGDALHGLIGVNPAAAVVVHKPAPTRVLRISHLSEGRLVHRVEPRYPPLAVIAHVRGTVVLHALIATSGAVESLEAVSGNPLLVSAAMEAVRQWRYQPYDLNGEAVEVETKIVVNFTMPQ